MNTIFTILGLTLGGFQFALGGDTERCYEELDCFRNGKPWSDHKRPIPDPATPQEINTKIICYSRKSPESFNISLWPNISLNGLSFKNNIPTVFITHGFSTGGGELWMYEMKDAYLEAEDAQVCLVFWFEGAKNYFKACSNMRIVAAELARFIKWLQREEGLNPLDLHLVGHSLGAHALAYCANAVGDVGRITGLDAAQPGFEGYDKEVRLDKGDANFVDGYHTNAAALFPFKGVGCIEPYGDVDIYFNGGRRQPGCSLQETFFNGSCNGFSCLTNDFIENLLRYTSCSHTKSHRYFIEALRKGCAFWGLASKMRMFKMLGDTDVIVTPGECTPDTCVQVGLYTPKFSGRGVFSVKTMESPPHCNSEENNVIVAQMLSNNLPEATKKILDTFHTLSKPVR